jgi:membrane fusion protein (multidrug efflux system)
MPRPASVPACLSAGGLPFAAAALAALSLAACGGDGRATPAAPAATSEKTAVPPVRVATAPVEVRDVASSLQAPGSIEAEEEIQVVAAVEGVVTRVDFHEGDRVSPKSVLAEIDPERYRLQAERAKARYDQTEALRQQAESELKRREELLRQTPPLVSAEELERARQELERQRAAAAEAKAAWSLAEQDRRRSIVAPIVPGIINRKSVVTGQHVDSDAVLATLVDTRRLRLRFRVTESESVRLKDGLPVTFTTAAWPGRTFEARLYHVSRSADPASRMVECLALIEDRDEALKPGFFAEVRAATEKRAGALLVPERAVLATERGFVVFEAEGHVARRREVTVGLRADDGAMEILTGLKPGAVVITDGNASLRDGAAIDPAAGSVPRSAAVPAPAPEAPDAPAGGAPAR